MAASPHASWFLDDITPAEWQKHLPAVYEVRNIGNSRYPNNAVSLRATLADHAEGCTALKAYS